MRPDSPALHAEQLPFPNQTHRNPRYAWLNSRESPTRLPQDEKNTDVTLGTQKWLVYPKSIQDEAHFPFIESIHISHSTSYTTSILYNNPEIPWDTHLKSIGTSISEKQQDEKPGHPISSGDESWIPVFEWRGKPSFHKHLKRTFPLGICMWARLCILCFKRNGPRDALIRKKSKFPCRGFMHAHRSYHKMKGCLSPL